MFKKKKKILIIQFRQDKSLAHDEFCFRETIDGKAALEFVNALEGGLQSLNLASYQGIILGGSGQCYLSSGEGVGPWQAEVFQLLDSVLDKDIPMLGVCFGQQLLGLHQGGQIVREESMFETGVFGISLLPQAKTDPLFVHMPTEFEGHLSHKDTLVDLPKHLVCLAGSKRVVCQAFRVEGKRAWGVLFHPEMNTYEQMCGRAKLFPEYLGGKTVEEFCQAEFRATPEAGRVLHNFIDLI